MDTLSEYWKPLLGLLLAPIVLPLVAIGTCLVGVFLILYLLGTLTWEAIEVGIDLVRKEE